MAEKRKTTSTKRRKTRRTPKPKVYIPAYKIIALCTIIITICMLLLLGTTLLSKPKQDSISARYDDIKTEVQADAKDNSTTKPKTEKIKKPKVTPPKSKKEPEVIVETPEVKKSENKEESKKTEVPVKEKPVAQVEKTEQAKPVEKPAEKPSTSSFNFPKAENGAQLIFVFDDGGHNINHIKKFLQLPFPYTVAVLPQLSHSKESAQLIRESGNEVILHQPMQAVNLSVDPGPGAIKPDMTESEIRSVLFQNVTEIGPVAGMNNHEGSAITADAEKMAVVLQFCSSEGIFFLDSRTNAKTAVPYVAKELGYSYFERNIFLDNEKTRDNILTELKKGLAIANKKGNVIMIGHIWSAEILPDILMEVYPELVEKGYTFSVVSKSKARKY